MWAIELVLIVLLLLALIFCIQKERRRDQELNYVIHKLGETIEKQTAERVKIVSSDQQVCELTVKVNELLDENHKNLAGYVRSQESMKRMLSNISHDLKTPLTVVLGYLELASLTEKSEQLQIVYQKVQEVLAMMNEFFDLAKLESKDKQYPVSRIDAAEVCRQSILDFYGDLYREGIQVEVAIPEQSLFLMSNAEALKRILHNLISNALRYGMDGKYFGFRLQEEDDAVSIEVIDHGKGIPEKHQEEVFERLYTLEDSRSSEYRGSGLGLSITKTLVDTLNGTIELTSEPYQKTVFCIRFPQKNLA